MHGPVTIAIRLAGSCPRLAMLVIAMALVSVSTAEAQLGTLVSPGPLSAAHASLSGVENCTRCHEPGKQVTAAKCLTCHKPVAERMARRVGVHRNVGEDCVACHIEHAGRDANIRPFETHRFDHAAETGFALDGRHAPIAADCAKCHTTRSFLTAKPACASCHEDPHKSGLGDSCATCHPTRDAFKDARRTFDHAAARFRLTGAHAAVACEKCHTDRAYRGVKFDTCASCHTDPHRPSFAGACATCHTTDRWKTTRVDHARTGFALNGAHQTIACAACHERPPMQARLDGTRCAACHTDVHRGTFKADCKTCHDERTFLRAAPFDHAGVTRFPLTGRHAEATCAACHKPPPHAGPPGTRTLDFRGASTACASCHRDVHRGELGARCEACHATSTFRVSTFAHPRFAEFFGGRHEGVACAACHVTRAPDRPTRTAVPVDGWTFKALPTACATCHQDAHLGQLGADCARCHTIESPKFAVIAFAHDRTAFPLTGAHAPLECAKCHRRETGDFPAGPGTAVRLKGLGTACASCHEDPHLGQLGPSCETCHAAASFKLPRYTHKGRSAFFGGAHETVACASCHKQEDGAFPAGRGVAVRYTGGGTACATCHEDAHRGALGRTCEACHTPTEWREPSRAFHKAGVFPLEGRHLTVPCASCHIGGVVEGTPMACADCHWQRRQDDPYRLRLGAECAQCHRPTSWTAVRWNHASATGVPLSALHAVLGCDACHVDRRFEHGSVDCVTCHREDYQRAENPNHQTAGFPTACDTCHRASHASWSQALFNHAQVFPLTGRHATVACAICHASGTYAGTPRDCVACHRADYDRTQAPNHAAAGFPTACESCHQPSATTWNTDFNHTAVFPLVGTHATQACVACHANNTYRGTPRDCIGCHRADYDRTQSPNHAAAGFPTTCESCHQASAASWRTSFNHNVYFPLLGRHVSQPCSACHVNNLYRGTPRDCFPCHQSAYDQTRNPNHRAAGFPTTCEVCHNAADGSWSQGRFNHTWFPITSGRHAGHPCSACHQDPNNYKSFTCLTCHGRDETDREHRGRAGYRYESAACYACHPTGRGD